MRRGDAPGLRRGAVRELNPCFVDLVQLTPDPFIQAIVDVVVPRMAFDRSALSAAAFVLRPRLQLKRGSFAVAWSSTPGVIPSDYRLLQRPQVFTIFDCSKAEPVRGK